jgi:hypothetical protein
MQHKDPQIRTNKGRSVQAPSAAIMIRPHHFCSNPQTLADNAFQQDGQQADHDAVAKAAYGEVTQAVETLRDYGVRIDLFEDEGTTTPDSVFLNNWFSTHSGGHVAIYPMFTPNRRLERRPDIVEFLKRDFRVQDVIDYSGLEPDGLFLEGTGAMVFDHIERVAYVVRSNRADAVLLERFCTHFNYEPMVFEAADAHGTPVYHTNVLMCIATDFAILGKDMIANPKRAAEIQARLEGSGRTVIEISNQQVDNFVGNAFELQGRDGRVLALSTTAYNAMTEDQRALISESATLVPLHVPTIETGGGSVRCMLAGNHLVAR